MEIDQGPPLSDEDARCLKQALMELFRNTPVVSLFNIRCEPPPVQARFGRGLPIGRVQMQIVMLWGHSATPHLPCREWLATARSAQLVSHFAQQSDTGLGHAVMKLDIMRQMGQAYVQTNTGSQNTDMFREVRLGTLPCPVAGAPCCRMLSRQRLLSLLL